MITQTMAMPTKPNSKAKAANAEAQNPLGLLLVEVGAHVCNESPEVFNVAPVWLPSQFGLHRLGVQHPLPSSDAA